MTRLLYLFIVYCFLLGSQKTYAQLIITRETSAIALAQKLVGTGVTVTNATYTGNSFMAGFFKNISGTNIGLDSGIVLSNGNVKTEGSSFGLDGNGVTPANLVIPDNWYDLPGDPDLTNATGFPSGDAAVLEFDFVALGDSINFRYVFGSDEYEPSVVCYFYDGFGFFISGPGITGLENIALVPGTNTAVSSLSINAVVNGDGTTCTSYPMYYVDNKTNTYFTMDGQTVVLTASKKIQPCQVYHLKLVIADLTTNLGVDSGVLIEANSLSSNTAQIINLTQTDPVSGQPYVVEGCSTGSIKIKRQYPNPSAQTVNLSYAGSALNSIDVQTLPASVIIPANQTEVLLNIIPVIDNLPEGIEILKIYTVTDPLACVAGTPQPTDSTEIEIRDYDTLSMNPRKINICRNSSIQLNASTGYATYVWDANATLNNTSINNPIANPTANATTYYCTASIGNCHARDSVFVRWKDIELLSKKDINCKNGITGEIKTAAGDEWVAPLLFAINNNAYQTDSAFLNLSAGSYSIKVKDATGCIDSIIVNLIQAYPDLDAGIVPALATCSGNADGQITVNASGGLAPYQYSIDNGINFQTVNSFNVLQGTYPVLIKDFNGCTYTSSSIVGLNNDLTLSVGNEVTICEGKNTTLQTISNAASYAWTPVSGLTSSSVANPIASPITTTKYYVTATKGICSKKDSILVNVNPAPVANAGDDITICFGADTSLQGSGGTIYSWSPATYLSNPNSATPDVVRPLTDISYFLQVTDANGCKSLNTEEVKVTVTAPVHLLVPADTSAAIYQPLQLYAIDINNSGIISYLWSPSYGLNNTAIANPITTLDHDMQYTVTGKTQSGCEAAATVLVKVYEGPEIYVPTAFTPNGDTKNDILRAKPIGIKTYHYFTVFNRWGQTMFSTTDFTKGWNGTIQGIAQNTGTYVWIAEGIDFKGNVIKRKGSTILIR